mgnify:FL=1
MNQSKDIDGRSTGLSPALVRAAPRLPLAGLLLSLFVVILGVLSVAVFSSGDSGIAMLALLGLWATAGAGFLAWLVCCALARLTWALPVAVGCLGVLTLVDLSLPRISFWTLLLLAAWLAAGAVWLLSLQLSVSDVRQKTATRQWIPLSLAAAIAVGVCAAVVTDLPFKARFELSKPALNDLASRDIIDDREQCVNFYCFNFIDSDNGEFVAELSITGESSLTWTRSGFMRGSDPPKSPRYSDVIDMGDDWYYFVERD